MRNFPIIFIKLHKVNTLICYFTSNIIFVNLWKADGKSTKQHESIFSHFFKNLIIFHSPSPSNSTAIALEYIPTSSSRR